MSYRNTKIFKLLKQKAFEERLTQYLAAIEKTCDSAVMISTQIVRTFPTFTLHNEVHFRNVLEIMANLIGEQAISCLTIEELAMLLLSACCHDLGMSVSKTDYDALTNPSHLHNLWFAYFRKHPDKKLEFDGINGNDAKIEFMNANIPVLVREFHHIRVADVLSTIEWDDILESPGVIEMAPLTRSDLALVCKSHGESLNDCISSLSSETADRLDLRMCAALLRLGDIMDFDSTRAPKTLYKFLALNHPDDPDTAFSKTEWDKHLTSRKFVISYTRKKTGAYTIPYSAVCSDPDVYKGICSYINWVDRELECCNKIREMFDSHLSAITFPYKVSRSITEKPYEIPESTLRRTSECCTDWLFGLPAHWGPFDSDANPQNANICEVLMAINMSGHSDRKRSVYDSSLLQLWENVTDKGLSSKSLKAETVQCTSLLLLLMARERSAGSSVIDDFSRLETIAANLWRVRNDNFGWGVYVIKTEGEDCSMANTYRAMRAINKSSIGNDPEFKNFVVSIFKKNNNGRFGFTLSDNPKLTTTAMMLCLYFELDRDIQSEIDKYYDAAAAVSFVYDKFVSEGVQLEIETFRGIDRQGGNTVKKAPWNNITIGYAIDALVSANKHGYMTDEAFSELHKRVRNILSNDVYPTGDGNLCYIPDTMERFNKKTPTYPTAYLLYGLSKLNENGL